MAVATAHSPEWASAWRTPDESGPNISRVMRTNFGDTTAKIFREYSDSLDLVQCCLRLRPDRIIVGEVRGREILDFLSASSTGHEGSFTSIHANNPRIAFMRMTQLYKQNNVPSMSDKKAIILMEARNPIKADKCYWFKDFNYQSLLKGH